MRFVCVSHKKMQCKTKTCGSKCNAKNDVSVTFEMAWHAIFKNRANQHVFYLKNSILKNMLSFRKRNFKKCCFQNQHAAFKTAYFKKHVIFEISMLF